ncbi:MAG TPA: DUF1778 domain-containing protein [Rhodoblastus sp.]|nr:DUF1778 domain-containing protein [Rhodoblastus sp.]
MSSHAATKARTVPRETLNIRVKGEDRALIDRAAHLLGKSRTDFLLESARRAAEDALLDQALFRADARSYKAFLDRLDAPPEPNERLRRMLAKAPPWHE